MTTKHTRRHDEDIISSLTRIIGAIDVVKNVVPVQLGQGILSTTSCILVIVKDTIKNKEDFRDLIEQCDWIRELIERGHWGFRQSEGGMSTMLSEALNELSISINRIYAQVGQRKGRRFIRRFFSSSVDKDRIADWTTSLDRGLKHFAIRLDMVMAESLRRVEQEVLNKRSETRNGLLPPPRPAIFFGRDELVDRILDSLSLVQTSERRHIALLGPGGIGKSSLAKAILNEPKTEAKFKSRRFFIRFDDILASQITYSTFVERVARTLGIPSSGHHAPILEYLGSGETLLALGNAETFLDPESSRDVSRIKSAIDEFGAFSSVSIVLTSRSRELPYGLLWKKFEVPNLDIHPAYEAFTTVYQQEVSQARPALEYILSAIGYHPLTITLLAHVAEVNEWSIDELVERWNLQHTQLLNAGHGKDHNLGESIELSLSSPCIRIYGNDVHRVLRMIAFFPQGIPRQNLKSIFPSIPQVHAIVDVLHKQSLLAFSDGFVTMLAPIRLYATDAIPGPDTSLLEGARRHYHAGLLADSNEAEVFITSEDVNIESLIAFDLRHAQDDDSLTRALDACQSFLLCLHDFKTRPTCLRPLIDAIDGARSPAINAGKVQCFYALAHLAYRQSNYLEALELHQITYDRALEAGLENNAMDALLDMADTHSLLGQIVVAKELLEKAEATENWRDAKPYFKAYAASLWGFIKQSSDAQVTGAALAALFKESERLYHADDHLWNAYLAGAESALAFALIDKNIAASRTALESAISKNHGNNGLCYCFHSLAAVASMEGKLDEAKQLLSLSRANYIRESWMTEATFILLDLAMIATEERKFDDARDLVKRASEELKIHGIVSAENRWLTLYTSGVVELAAGRVVEAYELFEQTKRDCTAQREFQIRAFSSRAMGEVAYLRKDFSRAKVHFEETVSICRDAGILPNLLYRRSSQAFLNSAPPTTYEGWPLFLRERMS